MAKKPPKETPHLRVRIEPRLLAKLEKARDRNGHTLTGEIVARLEQTFDADDTVALLRDQINEARQMYQPLLAQLEQYQPVMAQLENTRKEQSVLLQKLESTEIRAAEMVRKFEETEASAKMVNVLLGEDKQKSALLRRVALEIASWPQDWATNPAINNEIKERFRSTFAIQGEPQQERLPGQEL
jgi:predicted ribosome quality control (RQC) complex YloA/Tae2 family protein